MHPWKLQPWDEFAKENEKRRTNLEPVAGR